MQNRTPLEKDESMTNEEAVDLLRELRGRTSDKGYIDLSVDVNHLISALYIAENWYYDLKEQE